VASIYKPKDKRHWYISYIDPDTGRTKNQSTKLLAVQSTKETAEKICEAFEEELEERKSILIKLNIQKTTIALAFDHFLKMNADKVEKTKYAYNFFYKWFTKSFNQHDPCTVINKISAEDWMIKMRGYYDEPNTLYGLYKVLNKFLNFLFEYSHIPVFKLNKNVKPKPIEKPIKVFDPLDLEKMIKNLSRKKKNSNFTTMFYLLLYTGLRPSDLVDIKVEDVDIESMTLDYYSSKVKIHHCIPLHEKLKPIITKRINEIKSGKLINYATTVDMGKAFRRYLTSIKLTGKGYNLRTFRKNFATRAFENGINLLSASRLLGHRTMQTTQKYYTHVEKLKLAEELKKLSFKKGSKKGVIPRVKRTNFEKKSIENS
jgi:integrase